VTRIINTTFIATVLAVASLSLAGTAQADDPGQGIAIGEPPPGQLPPGTGAEPGPEPEPGPVAEDPDAGEEMGEDTDEATGEELEEETGEVDYTSPAYFKSKEALERFKRYCKMKDAEPSHSDKTFCGLYLKHRGTKHATKPRPAGIPARAGSAGIPRGTGAIHTSRGSGSARASTATDDSTPAGGSTRPSTATAPEQPAAQVEQPSKGSLPFTGFEVWELALLGVALIGGALAARRLLDS